MYSIYTPRAEDNPRIEGGQIFARIDHLLSLNPRGLNEWELTFLGSLAGRPPYHEISAKQMSCLRRILNKARV